MQFEWDEKKEKINIEKHGIDFSTAAQETQQQLTTALTTAQALHAGTIQQQMIEDKQEQGFFKKIFNRKGKDKDQ